jgi:phage tail sheath protein FI
MSKLYKTTGDAIAEVSNLPTSITSVETAVPAFIGYTSKAQKLEIGDLLFNPTRIDSLPEYEMYFGTKVNESITLFLADEMENTLSGHVLVSRKIEVRIAYPKNNMHYHLQHYFANGGGPCYIVSVGKPKQTIAKRDLRKGLDEVYQYAKPTLLVFPDALQINRAADLYSLYNDALAQAAELGDRIVIMDLNDQDLQGKNIMECFRESVTGGQQAGSLQFGAAYFPNLVSEIPYHYADSSARIHHEITINEPGKEVERRKGEFDLLYLNNPRLSGTELYASLKKAIADHTMLLGPCSSIAGAYAAADHLRGVWKAPANISLKCVRAPSQLVTESDQAVLNVDPVSGKSINAIRQFPGKGTLIWGARTLAGNDRDWRYISVRRFFNMVEESVKKTIEEFAFERNEMSTWLKVRSLIEAYLMGLWQKGALAGAKPEHAFFVRVGLGQTMTAQDILEGRMNIEIGLAPARPAEFTIARIMQPMQVS